MPELRTVHLHGALGQRFGTRYRLDIATPADAIRACSALMPGFRQAIEDGPGWHVCVNGIAPEGQLRQIDLCIPLATDQREVHFLPTFAGAKDQGLGKVLLGTALIAASFFVPAGGLVFGMITKSTVAMLGLSTALTGISQMLMPAPDSGYDDRDKPQSEIFSSAVNITTPGAAVPVVAGRCVVGSRVASIALHVEDSVIDVAEGPDDTLFGQGFFGDHSPFGGGFAGEGGGKAASARTPKEDPDTLLVNSRAYIIDVVSEGPIGGWANAENPGRSILFDGVPLQNADGSFNFEDVEFTLAHGTPDQPPVPGFSAVENEVGVGQVVTVAVPVTRVITNEELDALRIKVGVNALTRLDEDNGDLKGTEVEYAIEMQSGTGPFERIVSSSFNGKTTSGYQRAHRINLPQVRPLTVRVVRVTPDSEIASVSDDIFFTSYTEVIDAHLSMPGTAYVALSFPALTFGNKIPVRSFDLIGVDIQVPTNYDPVTRTYDEGVMWDGTMKTVSVDPDTGCNPAWFLYSMLTNGAWGFGDRIAADLTNKWVLYPIAKYCDALVNDGFGGMEPRYTISGVFNTREQAYEIVRRVAAMFRALVFWSAGAIEVVQDAPRDPVKLVTNGNVIGGGFTYTATARQHRFTSANVSIRDARDGYTLKPLVSFDDPELVERFGWRVRDVAEPECSSLGQGLRTAKWVVETTRGEKDAISYVAGLDHQSIRPGDRIRVADRHNIGLRAGGRLTEVLTDTVRLDAPYVFDGGTAYQIALANKTGGVLFKDILPGASGSLDIIPLASSLTPGEVKPGAVFQIISPDLEPPIYTVMQNRVKGAEYLISAISHDPGKYDRVENGLIVDTAPSHIFPSQARPLRPADLTHRSFYKTGQGDVARPHVSIGWSRPNDARISTWVAEIQEQGRGWARLPILSVPTVDVTLSEGFRKTCTFRVKAVTATGQVSEWATYGFFAAAPVPADVTGFSINVVRDIAVLSWVPVPDTNIAHYRIRHTPLTLGASYVTALDLIPQVGAGSTTVTVPARTGTYFIKAVDRTGTASNTAAEISISVGGGYDINVVETITEDPTFAGGKTNVVSRGETLVLAYVTGSGGPMQTSGIYDFATPLDLGAIYVSRVSAELQYLRADQSSWWSNEAQLWSEIEESWLGDPSTYWSNETRLWSEMDEYWLLGSTDVSDLSVVIQVRTTKDDPSGTPVWSEWRDLLLTTYSARAFEFRALMQSLDQMVTPVVTRLSVQIDMPDRRFTLEDIASGAAPYDVLFGPAFQKIPAVNVTMQDGLQGDYHTVTEKTVAGCRVTFFNASGTVVDRTFDLVANGYGAVQS